MLSIDYKVVMIFLDVLMIIYSLWVFNQFNQGNKLPIKRLFLISILWLISLHLLISEKHLFAEDISSLMFYCSILLGVTLVGVLLFLVSPLRSILMNLTQQQLLLLQGIRVFFGAGFLVMAATGELPLTFGIIDGLTHISAGFFGLIAAFSWAVSISAVRRAWFANLFGLADILIVATSLAFLLLPQIGPHHSMMYAVFLPAPLWLWFHVISIVKLWNQSNAIKSNH
jgi:hypothetical protein